MTTLLQPEERVLSTLNADGSRRWLDPKPVKGFFRSRRMVLAWVLIAIFNVLPHLHLDGRQLFFLNIGGGEFTFFGVTFLRTDTLLLALFAITVALSIFLATAVFGRVWCGWACPQTVYLEFLFRPIAGLFDGKSKKGLRGAISVLPKGLRQALRWAVVVFVCFHLSNTFLAYFVGSRTVFEWSLQPPWVHPGGFAFVLFVTAAMVADFGFFREQVCFIACPYGRLQSVLLDRQSLIVGYDYNRGEPRGKFRKNRSDPRPESISLKVVGEGGVATAEPEGFTEPKQGDCVDCNRCVAVCPTGIDIRDGLQLECIHCTRCIDACDEVMEKVGRDPGLIRYSSQSVLAGERSRFLRPRVIIYPVLLLVACTALLTLSASHAAADIRIIRAQGNPYYELPTGEISNQIRLRITNRTSEPRSYTVEPAEAGYRLEAEGDLAGLEPGETRSVRLLVVADRQKLAGTDGVVMVPLTVRDDDGFELTRESKFLGPMGVRAEPAQSEDQSQDQAEEISP